MSVNPADIDPNEVSARFDAQMKDIESARQQGRIVAPADEIAFGETKMQYISLRISPLSGFAIKTMHAHLDEMAPGARSGRHRHASEAIMYVAEGAGYSVIDDVRHDWSAGDAFVVPSNSWHQHFNASDTNRTRVFTVSNWPLTVATGLGYMENSEVNARFVDNAGKPGASA
jgi:gentisate 1,2-dioxygenase